MNNYRPCHDGGKITDCTAEIKKKTCAHNAEGGAGTLDQLVCASGAKPQ